MFHTILGFYIYLDEQRLFLRCSIVIDAMANELNLMILDVQYYRVYLWMIDCLFDQTPENLTHMQNSMMANTDHIYQ